MKRTQREYKVIDFSPLTTEEQTVLQKLENMPDSEINYDDISPSVSGSRGGFYYCQTLKVPKTAVHIIGGDFPRLIVL